MILDDDHYYLVPRGGKTIITYDDINLDPIESPVAEIEQGNFLILPDTHHGDLQDSILDLTKQNIHKIRAKAFLWKTNLQDAININNITLEDLEIELARGGVSRKLMTIKNWFKDPHLIAPQNPDKVFKVFASILGKQEGYFDESLDNVSTLYKARKKVMDDLPTYLKAGTFEDETNILKMDINGKLFKASLYEVLGSENAKASPEDLYKLRELDA